MTEQQITSALTQVFRNVFDDDTIVISRKTTARDIEDWDSIMHITLIGAVEKRFHMRFSMKQVSTMKNVGEMMDIIAASAQ